LIVMDRLFEMHFHLSMKVLIVLLVVA